jgi:hypothetical protein
MVRNKTVLLKLPVLKQTDSRIECMHANATCWVVATRVPHARQLCPT